MISEAGIEYNRGDFLEVQGDSESHWIAILLEVRQTYLRVC